MSLCTSIDTLAMAYLDDELAAEERRELELHMHDCATCRQHVDAERVDHDMLRQRLVAPPAPDMLKMRLARALDGEDVKLNRAERTKWMRHLLPGSAMIAAAAALVAFITIHPKATSVDPLAEEAVRIQRTHPPVEVQGVSTQPWLQEHFEPNIVVPQFAPGIQVVGARLTAVNGHDAALIAFEVTTSEARYGMSALVIRNIHPDDFSDGVEVKNGSRTLHVLQADGMVAVTYVGPDHMGYAFMSDRVSADELLDVVVSSDLIGRMQQGH